MTYQTPISIFVNHSHSHWYGSHQAVKIFCSCCEKTQPNKMLRPLLLCCLLFNAAMLCYAQLRRDSMRPSKRDNYTFDLPSHLMQPAPAGNHECILTIYQDLLNGATSVRGSPHLNLFSAHAQMSNTVRCLNGIQTGEYWEKNNVNPLFLGGGGHLLSTIFFAIRALDNRS